MHMWEDKGAEMLRVIQLNTLEDRSVHDKFQWDSAINFLQSSLQEKLEISEANLRYIPTLFINLGVLKASSFISHKITYVMFSGHIFVTYLQLIFNPF